MLNGRLPGARLQLTPIHWLALWALVHCGEKGGCRVKSTKCSSFVAEWPLVPLCSHVCDKRVNIWMFLSLEKKCLTNNYIILWIRVTPSPHLIRTHGCTCDPAVMRQCLNHTLCLFSSIMYIISTSACKKQFLDCKCTPIGDLSTQKAKIKVQAHRESVIFAAGFLCATIFSIFPQVKGFLCLVLFSERLVRGRQPWPCYFCSSYRKQEPLASRGIKKKNGSLRFIWLLMWKAKAVRRPSKWTGMCCILETFNEK